MNHGQKSFQFYVRYSLSTQVASARRQVLMHSEFVGSQLVMHVKVSSTQTSLQTSFRFKSLKKDVNFLYHLLKPYLRTTRINWLFRLVGKGQAKQNWNDDSHFDFSYFPWVLFIEQPLSSHSRNTTTDPFPLVKTYFTSHRPLPKYSPNIDLRKRNLVCQI